MNNVAAQQCYSTLMSVVYLMAFMSYWVQFPAVGGADGVMPVAAFWNKVRQQTRWEEFPNLLWAGDWLMVEPVVFYEACLAIGVLLSILSCFGWSNGVFFTVLWAIYHMVVTTGQSLLAFQWDVLILETGFIAIFYSSTPSQIFAWLPKITAFKLFLMSGSLKVLSNCPTWPSLTALKYHYASQCIPTPAAWWAALLPGWFQEASLSFVMWGQIFGTLLLISPWVVHRRAGVVVQVLSMLGIQITGNYNWFNIHSAGLALMSWFPMTPPAKPEADDPTPALKTLLFAFAAPLLITSATPHQIAAYGLASLHLVSENFAPILQVITLITYSVYTYHAAYGIPLIAVEKNVNAASVKSWINLIMPTVVPYILFSIVLSGAWEVVRAVFFTRGRGFLKFIQAVNLCLYTGLAVVIATVSLGTMSEVYSGVNKDVPRWPGKGVVMREKDAINQKLHIASAYGLFRVMTGVGDSGEVAVPVVVFEYDTEEAKGEWKELSFRYAVGDVERPLPWVAPHQPRIDWRLWFAALGNTRSDPWVVHMVVKLLNRSPAVLAATGITFPKKETPHSIRAMLYHYDFTTNTTATAYWTRKKVRPWMPPITRDSPDVKNFLAPRGWSSQPIPRSKLTPSLKQCKSPFTEWICHFVKWTQIAGDDIRKHDAVLPVLGALFAAAVLRRTMHWARF